MAEYTLKSVSPMGERDPKFGQTYWGYVAEAQMPVMFNLTQGNPQEGQKVTFEERTIKEGKKGEYMRLSKTKLVGAEQTQTQTKFQQRPDYQQDIKAEWAIGQALSKFPQGVYEATGSDRATMLTNIEDFAKELFAMVDRVKAPIPTIHGPKPEGAPLPQPPVDDVHPYDEEEPINLDDIPF